MNQKGFATIFGLCMILAIALCVKGIQESEENFSSATTDFQGEFELQNAAISGIYEAAEKVCNNSEILPKNFAITYMQRPKYQVQLVNRTIKFSDEKKPLKEITLKVWGERLDDIRTYNVKRYTPKKELELVEEGIKGYMLFGVAEGSDRRMNRKIYRSVLAYVRDDDDTKIIFMEPLD